jgi:transcriptional regulator with PAS, ATPase and Fis domain
LRKDRVFFAVDCGTLSGNLLESELFGHVKGAFTGAHRGRLGRFQAADQGGLFLDEIGDVPLTTQVKLLRVLEEKEIERVGDHRPIKVDVRIITATNKDLETMVDQKAFRDDLFYRINVIPIHVAPLRSRSEDIPLLAHAFCERVSLKSSQPVKTISPEAMDLLLAYPWPGNVRELQSAIEYAHVLCQHDVITSEHLPHKIADGSISKTAAAKSSDALPLGLSEKELLVEALRRAQGNQSEAGRLLGVSRVTVWKRMKKYGLNINKDLGSVSGL